MILMRRLAARGPQILLILTLLLPAGCVQTIGGMVVKHVAMSAAKDVVKDQYNEYKEKQKRKDDARDARRRSSPRTGTQPARTPPGDSEDPAP